MAPKRIQIFACNITAKNTSFLMEDQLECARQAKKEKKEVYEENSLEKRMTLMNNQIQYLRKENQLLKQRLDSLVHSDINKTLEENIILNDLFHNAQKKKNQKIKIADQKPLIWPYKLNQYHLKHMKY